MIPARLEDFGIAVPSNATGEIKTTCPKCSPTRKKKKFPCLSVNLGKGAWHCWHCGWSGGIRGALDKRTPTFSSAPTAPVTSERSTAAYAVELWARTIREDKHVSAHPYAIRKRIGWAFGAGRAKASGRIIGRDADCIVVPIRKDGVGSLVAVQVVNTEGAKQTFGPMGDAYLLLGDERDRGCRWFVVEGWATAHAIADHYRRVVVAVSFGKSRLDLVAERIARVYRDGLKQIVVLPERAA
jgi:phage/plasmid primase-like uncharacterized protein